VALGKEELDYVSSGFTGAPGDNDSFAHEDLSNVCDLIDGRTDGDFRWTS
jgi:hypothetical protein